MWTLVSIALAPVDVPTPMHTWEVLTGLSGLLKTKRKRIWHAYNVISALHSPLKSLPENCPQNFNVIFSSLQQLNYGWNLISCSYTRISTGLILRRSCGGHYLVSMSSWMQWPCCVPKTALQGTLPPPFFLSVPSLLPWYPWVLGWAVVLYVPFRIQYSLMGVILMFRCPLFKEKCHLFGLWHQVGGDIVTGWRTFAKQGKSK